MRELGGEYRDGSIWIGVDRYTVRIVDWDEQKEKAALVTANNPRIQGTWTPELEDLLRDLQVSFEESFFDVGLEALADSMRLVAENDPAAEWKDMPEFSHEDKTAFRSVIVHFKDQEAVDGFSVTVNHKLTDATKYIWFPQIEIETMMDKRYVSEEEAEDEAE